MQRPLGNKWPKPRYFMLIAVVTGLLGVLIAFLVAFTKTYYVFRPTENKYDILVDLLVIVLASGSLLIGAIGYGIYRFLSERIERQAVSAARMEGHFWAAYTLTNEGLELWNSYQRTTNPQELMEAIQKTERAYNMHGMWLDERQREYEYLICDIRNNLGYYLAERRRPEDRAFARQCALYIQSRILKFPEAQADWGKTITFIFSKYP